MPGATPHEAVDAFTRPLRESLGCVTRAHLTLSQNARKTVGESHAWVLNGGLEPATLAPDVGLEARMIFEILDQGASRRSERFRVSTRAYLYALVDAQGRELIAAHWHPGGKSHVEYPHWHAGSAVLSPDGVFLKRAHIPSPRVSLEYFLTWAVETLDLQPGRDNWRDVLDRNRESFEEHRSWGD